MGELHNFEPRRARPKKPPAPPNPTMLLGAGLFTALGLYFVYSEVEKGVPALDALVAYLAVMLVIAFFVTLGRSVGHVGRYFRHRTALRKLEADQAELSRQADQGSSISRIKLLQTPTRDPRKIPWREW